MVGTLGKSRCYHVGLSSLGVSINESTAPRPPAGRYTRLVQISVTHSYYGNGSEDDYAPCPDFIFQPTPTTAALMASTGMILRADHNGFSVLSNEDGLGQAIARAGAVLSFVMLCTNDLFVNFTAMPIDFTPMEKNLYFSNLTPEGKGKRKGKRVTGTPVLRPLILQRAGPEFQVSFGNDSEVVIYDPRNVAVITEHRKIHWPPAGTPNGPGPKVERKSVCIDLSALPYDVYRREGGSSPVPPTFLYSAARPQPMGLIDLFVGTEPHQPLAIDPQRPSGHPQPGFEIRFDARKTVWTYLILPPPTGSYADLRITGDTAAAPVRFTRQFPDRVLPDGTAAQQFAASRSLPITQRPPFRFTLSGRRVPLETHERTLLSPLPVVSAATVRPTDKSRSDTGGTADIFVTV